MRARAALRAMASLALPLAVCAALPGEMNSCTTDLSDEIDPRLYCRNRCDVLCERLVTCRLYHPVARPDEDTTDLDLCRAVCEQQYQCVSPLLCVSLDAYVSVKEATECLDSWARVSCDRFVDVPRCASDFGACPRPQSCRSEELCDPPGWE